MTADTENAFLNDIYMYATNGESFKQMSGFKSEKKSASWCQNVQELKSFVRWDSTIAWYSLMEAISTESYFNRVCCMRVRRCTGTQTVSTQFNWFNLNFPSALQWKCSGGCNFLSIFSSHTIKYFLTNGVRFYLRCSCSSPSHSVLPFINCFLLIGMFVFRKKRKKKWEHYCNVYIVQRWNQKLKNLFPDKWMNKYKMNFSSRIRETLGQ